MVDKEGLFFKGAAEMKRHLQVQRATNVGSKDMRKWVLKSEWCRWGLWKLVWSYKEPFD